MLLKYLIIPEFPSKSVNTVDDAREVTNELINSMWESSILVIWEHVWKTFMRTFTLKNYC